MAETTSERTKLDRMLLVGTLVLSLALIVFVAAVARGNVAAAAAVEDGPIVVGPGAIADGPGIDADSPDIGDRHGVSIPAVGFPADDHVLARVQVPAIVGIRQPEVISF